MDTWSLVENRFVPNLAAGHEALFTTGNGYLSTRGSFEEARPGEQRGTFIQGLWVTPPGELPILGAVPDWTGVELFIDGTRFSLESQPAGYRRTLDFSSGVLTREILWRGPETGVCRLRFRRLLSMANRHLAAMEVQVTALTAPITVRIETGIDCSIPSPLQPAWNPKRWTHTRPAGLGLDAESIDGAQRLEVRSVLFGPGIEAVIREPRRHRWVGERNVGVGETVTYTKYAHYRARRDRNSLASLPDATRGFDDEARASARSWKTRWRGSDLEVGGDPESEQALRFAAFHLIAAAARNDPEAGIGAKLASGFGYRHHVFWDTDIFVIPYFAVSQPELARSHLMYRYQGLDGARHKAKKYGREGAFYAWESAGNGAEATPEWGQPPIGAPVRIWTGELEEHITSDVAYAIDTYWKWSGDHRFMIEQGIEIVAEGATYWASRLELDSDGAHLRDVIGPDEYHVHVTDSFFTNVSAAWHLRFAADLVDWGRKKHPRAVADLATRLHIDDEAVKTWRSLSARVVKRRGRNRVWEQHRGFFDLEPMDLTCFDPRRSGMWGLLSEERLQGTQVIKQADVVMALALFPDDCGSRSDHLRNWNYYVTRTDHGSSLSPAAHSRVASQLGLVDAAYDFFRQAIDIDLEDSMGNGRDGIHAATQGGVLQAALFGFAGLGLKAEGPHVNPRLPTHWDFFNFTTTFRGKQQQWETTNRKGATS
jgi:trehalose/maltose hydrolase-like predicted phosphorylase